MAILGDTIATQVTSINGFIGNGSGLTSLNASNISSGTLNAARLATSGASAGSYGPSAAVTGTNNTTMNVPYITVDAYGRVTSISNKVYTSKDTTYAAGTGLSLSGTTFNHSNSVTAGTAGTSSATSGSTLAVPYVTFDAQGHVTAVGTHTHTVTGFAATSHGNHVPATQTANNAVFLRNDNTWQTVTPANIGAAASSHTHNYAGSSSAGGAATSLANFKVTTTANNAIDTPGSNAIAYASGLTKANWNYQQTDGGYYCQWYSASWFHEIFGDYRTGQISVRGNNNGTKTAWRRVLDESNYSSIITGYAAASHGNHVPATQTANNAVFLRNDNTWQTVTPANIGAAASSHTHSNYLTAHQTIKQNGVTGATGNCYGACSTAAATAAKAVSITAGTPTLEAGLKVTVKFANANTANSPTLNVNSLGAKNIFHNGAQITSGANKALLAGACDFVYDGTQFHLVGNYIDTNTQTVTGVKGNSESSYRTGNVNITAANIGAAASNHNHNGTYTPYAASVGSNQKFIYTNSSGVLTAANFEIWVTDT